MGHTNVKRILACGGIVAAGVAVAVGCPILAPAVAALGSDAVGGKVLDSIAGVASNIFAADVQSALDGGFDPQTNHDLHIAIGQAIAYGFTGEARRLRRFGRDRRRCQQAAAVASSKWVETKNVGAFPPLKSTEAIHHLAAAAGEFGTAPPVFESWRDWLQVFGELRRLGDIPLPDQAVQERVAKDLHERFPVYLRNIIKGDANQGGANRAFNALHLDFMRLVLSGQAETTKQLRESKQLTQEVLGKLKVIEGQLAGSTRKLTAGLDPEARERLAGISHGIERAEKAVAEVLGRLDRVQAGVDSVNEKADRLLTMMMQDQAARQGTADLQTRAKELDAGAGGALQKATEDAVRTLVEAAEHGNREAAEAIAAYERTRDVEKFKAFFDEFTNEADAVTIDRHRQRAALMYRIGDIERALDSLHKVLALDPDDFDAHNQLGHVYFLRGDLAGAEAEYRKYLDGNSGNEWAEAVSRSNLGNVLFTRSDLDGAEAMYRQGLAIFEKLGRSGGMADNYGNLANVLRKRGDYDGAESMHRRSLEIDEKLGRAESMAINYGNLGVIWGLRGDLSEAEAMYRRALAINEGIGSPRGMANNIANLGLVLKARGDLDGAQSMLRRALEINQKLGNSNGMANDFGHLAGVLLKRGDMGGAEAMYCRALEVNEKLGSPEGMASDYGNLGSVLMARSNLDGAEAAFRRALEIYEKLGRPEGMASGYGNLGIVLSTRGDLNGADAMYRRALEIYAKLGRAEEMSRLYGSLGRVLRKQGDLDGAEAMYRRALEIDEKLGRLEGMAQMLSILGIIAKARGDLAGARAAWTRGLELSVTIKATPMIEKTQKWLADLNEDGKNDTGVDSK